MPQAQNIVESKSLGALNDPSRAVVIDFEKNGLESLRQYKNVHPQTRPHSHNEIEILLLEEGAGTWLMGGEIMVLRPGQLIVYWGIKPHQLITCKPSTIINWLTLPLAVFTEWQLPEKFSKSILAGEVLIAPDKSRFSSDKLAFLSWHDDLKSEDKSRPKLALLEIQARLARLAHALDKSGPRKRDAKGSIGLMSHYYFEKIAGIAEHVARHFSEDISVPSIAKAVDMHPKSATKIFKKICGMNLMHYLAQYRIIHAQRMLVSTDMKILDVALESGYQSVSRFYAAFKEFCGVSPQEFRQFSDAGRLPLDGREGIWRAETFVMPEAMQKKLKVKSMAAR